MHSISANLRMLSALVGGGRRTLVTRLLQPRSAYTTAPCTAWQRAPVDGRDEDISEGGGRSDAEFPTIASEQGQCCPRPARAPRYEAVKALDERDLEEKFIRGWGKGGQKVNKTSSAVHLVHMPTGLAVKVHDFRSQMINRSIARRILAEKVNAALHGTRSKEQKRADRARRRKSKRKARARQKYGGVDDCADDVHGQ